MANAEYSETKAKDYLSTSSLVYCPPANLTSETCGPALRLASSLGFEYMFGYDNINEGNPIYMTFFKRPSQKEIIIAFSGTITTKQLINEFTQSLPVKYEIHSAEEARVFNYFYTHYTETFRQPMLEEISTLVNDSEFEGYKFIFTGHSLGGALAMHGIADAILSEVFPNTQKELWTYGQPRVGNQEFLDLFVTEIDKYYRIVNNRDIVAHVPP